MHKSRLAGFIIDCQTPDLHQAADFWSQALGLAQQPLSPQEAQRYIGLHDPTDELHIEVQAVEHPSRVHLDIETDDIEAEVARLESLGATRVAKVSTWWVMQAPTGQRFCVIRKSSRVFDERAHHWDP